MESLPPETANNTGDFTSSQPFRFSTFLNRVATPLSSTDTRLPFDSLAHKE